MTTMTVMESFQWQVFGKLVKGGGGLLFLESAVARLKLRSGQ